MGLLTALFVLLFFTVILIAMAEWPRLQKNFGLTTKRDRQRAKLKSQFRVVRNTSTTDMRSSKQSRDFAKSVKQDIENLPVIDPDDRS